MSVGSISQFSTSSPLLFNAQNVQSLAASSAPAIATRIKEASDNNIINRAALNNVGSSTSSDKSTTETNSRRKTLQANVSPSRTGRSRINPYDDTPVIEPDLPHSQEHDEKHRNPYNPNPFFSATQKNRQLSAGPARLNLHQLKKSRQLAQSEGQKKPLIFGTHFSPGQHVREMLRCLALMVEPIRTPIY